MEGMKDDLPRVRPDGLAVRRRRHAQGWSARDLIEAVAEAQRIATGVAAWLTPDLLAGIEERNEVIPYATLCLLAAGFDCDPVDLLAVESSSIPHG
jgi:transcriptional regulator with XRE-family HTH domain